MSDTHTSLVTGQFGPRADAYVDSAVHARGEDLIALEALVARARPARFCQLRPSWPDALSAHGVSSVYSNSLLTAVAPSALLRL